MVLLSIIMISLSSCEEDDTKPATASSATNNNSTSNNFKVGGTLTAEVDGVTQSYSEVIVSSYGLSGNKGRITGIDSTKTDTTYKLNVIIPLENGTTGTFNQSDNKGYEIEYLEVVNSTNAHYNYKIDHEYEINISTHDKIGERNDTTFYQIVGTFNFHGEIYQPYFNTVSISNGSFDFIAYEWNGSGW